MNTLFIDTHLWDINTLLLHDGLVVKKEEVKNKKNNSEYIFPSIVKVIDGIKLDEIIVVNGPGSFTGVRLGVTIAKTLAYTLNIPIKTITALEVMAISNEKKHVAFSDNNGYYVGDFDNNKTLIGDYSYVSDEEFAKLNKDNTYSLDYNVDAEKIYEFLKNREPENAHQVKPVYIKKIGVELDKKSN